MDIPLDLSPSGDPIFGLKAQLTIHISTTADIIDDYDKALWTVIKETSRAYPTDYRSSWISSEGGKLIITGLRNIHRLQPRSPTLRPLDLRRSAIGLSLAASLGDRLAVKIILSSAEFKAVQTDLVLDHALFMAVFSGQENAIPALIERGASVNGCCYRSIGTPLQAAVKARRLSLVRMLLLRGAKFDTRGNQGTPLHIAANRGSGEMVQLLLQNGHKVDSQSHHVTKGICHETPLCTAVINGMDDMVAYLLRKGADINRNSADECAYCFTPLRNAASAGNIRAMQILLQHKADPYAGQYSALHDAVFYGQFDAVKLLIDEGVDINFTNNGDRSEPITPLDSAIYVDGLVRNGPDYLSIIRFLLENGGKTICLQRDNETDLHWWAAIRHPDFQEYRTLGPMDRNNFETILQILLDRGANINARGINGQTPLHRAIKKKTNRHFKGFLAEKHNPMPHIRLLLDHGADPDIKDNDGKTAMDLAKEIQWGPAYMERCPPW